MDSIGRPSTVHIIAGTFQIIKVAPLRHKVKIMPRRLEKVTLKENTPNFFGMSLAMAALSLSWHLLWWWSLPLFIMMPINILLEKRRIAF